MTAPPRSPLHAAAPHESALLHTTGAARYVDDLPEPPGLLHAVIATAPVARGKLKSIEITPALRAKGVVTVLTAQDIPGDPLIGPIVHDEPVLSTGEILYRGQPVALVLGTSREEARIGASLLEIAIDAERPVLDIDEALALGRTFGEPHVIARGDVAEALARAAVRIEAEVHTPAQDHFYLETQCALAATDEHGITVWSSTQHPTEIQRMVAHVLRVPQASVSCVVPRLGGGFGGKESQATVFGCLAALGAKLTGRPVKVWLSRHEDMLITGKRHPFRIRYQAGFDAEGRILAFDADVVSDGGCTEDLSLPIVDRCLFHLDNSYYIPALRFRARVARTDRASNTAFRGFGGPQGVVAIEDAMQRAAVRLGIDPVELRRRNFYGGAPRDRTPYGQQVTDPRIGAMTERLLSRSAYTERRAEIDAWNARSTHLKRGIGFAPVKFGISFTNSLLNQAGALVLVYADGTVGLNHGGTEMGQGLHTKMIAVCSDVLGVLPSHIRVLPTSTEKVPNTSATAASSGSDLNGQAVREACEILRERLMPVARGLLSADEREPLQFTAGSVWTSDGRQVSFGDVAKSAWLQRVSLSAAGFYRTPGIAYDRRRGEGTPFYYFAYGCALAEVELCDLTGESRIRRIDVLHDVGDSLIPSIDVGQVEGALVQGIGWLTGEDVLYADDGGVKTLGPSTYKIPSVGDVPLDLRVELLEGSPQPGTIGGSKAVGEPPLMLGIAVWTALFEAVRAFGGDVAKDPALARPATAEALLRAITSLRG